MSALKQNKTLQGLLLAAPVFAALAPVAALVLRAHGGPAVAYLLFWVVLPGAALARLLGVPARSGWFVLYAFFLGAGALFVLFYALRLPGLPLAAAEWGLRLLPPAAGAAGLAAWALRGRQHRHGAGVKLAPGRSTAAPSGLADAAPGLPARLRAIVAEGSAWRHSLPLWLVAAAVWLAFALTTLAYSSPTQAGLPDYYWHMGNIHTLASSPGFEDIRVAGMTFRYHYFADLVWAAGRLAVGLEPFYCVLRYPALLAPLCAVAVWGLMGQATRRPWLRFAASFAVLFAAPLYGAYNDFTYQWATGINAVGLALPCALLLMHAGQRALTAGARAGWRDIVLVGVLAALTAGFKGPFALCALAVLCGGLLARWLGRLMDRRAPRKAVAAGPVAEGGEENGLACDMDSNKDACHVSDKQNDHPASDRVSGVVPACGQSLPNEQIIAKNWWMVLLTGAAGFALVWFTLLSAGLNDSYIKSWQPFYSVYTAEVLAPLLNTPLGSPAWVRALLTPVHLVVVLGVLAVPFVAACVRFVARVVRRRSFGDMPLFPLAGAVASLLVFYMLDLTGRSQFYFLYFAVPMAGAVAAWEVDRCWLRGMRRAGGRPGAAGQPVPAAGKAGKATSGGVRAMPLRRAALALAALAGGGLMLFALTHPMVEWGADHYSPYELEAAQALKAQAAPGEKAAINRHVVHYFSSAMSGVQFWLEGDAYAKNSGLSMEDLAPQREAGDALFRAETPDKAALAESMGVRWLVQYMRDVSDTLTAEPGAGFELVYDSPDVRVWKRA